MGDSSKHTQEESDIFQDLHNLDFSVNYYLKGVVIPSWLKSRKAIESIYNRMVAVQQSYKRVAAQFNALLYTYKPMHFSDKNLV